MDWIGVRDLEFSFPFFSFFILFFTVDPYSGGHLGWREVEGGKGGGIYDIVGW